MEGDGAGDRRDDAGDGDGKAEEIFIIGRVRGNVYQITSIKSLCFPPSERT